jgi:hypothetical protein
MLRSLSIQNFRLLRALTLPKVGNINLIVGGNNIGKSCLLEAIRIYGEEGHPRLLRELIRQRHEHIQALSEGRNEHLLHPSLSDPLRSLFSGYQFPEDTVFSIRIGSADPDGRLVELVLAAYHTTIAEDGSRDQQRLSMNDALHFGDDADFYLESRMIQAGDVAQRMLSRLGHKNQHGHIRWNPVVHYVPASGWESEQTLQHWSHVAIRPTKKARVIKAIQLIDPGIQDIALIPVGGLTVEPIAVYDDVKRLPLRAGRWHRAPVSARGRAGLCGGGACAVG